MTIVPSFSTEQNATVVLQSVHSNKVYVGTLAVRFAQWSVNRYRCVRSQFGVRSQFLNYLQFKIYFIKELFPTKLSGENKCCFVLVD